MQSWATTVLNASSRARTEIKDAVLEGVKYFKAKFKKVGQNEADSPTLEELLQGPHKYKLSSYDEKAKQLFHDLKNEKGVQFIGFVPEINYMKETGPKDHLDAIWNHPFGSPALLYAHKDLPILIIAGPDIMFNDSIVKSIASNKWTGRVYGVTG